MRSLGFPGLIGAILVAIGPALADSAPSPKKEGDMQICIQVVACGTKDGKRRQYPTPCDARADGATDVAPMEGASCS
jgi:hypothetical protein